MIIKTLLTGTKHKVHVCSLPNVKDAGKPHDLYTRDEAEIDAFLTKEDVAGRGVFYCVSTVEGKRNVTNARETAFIHADVDFKHIEGGDVAGLTKLQLPPSWLVMSGHGMHLYWALHEPTTEDVTDILKNVCGIVCGDAAVTHRAAVMRMPGTTNSKEEPHILVSQPHDTGHRYTLEQLRAWRQDPVLRRKGEAILTDDERAELAGLEAFAAEYKPRIDVEGRLAGMEYQGAGDSGVHATQLHVTAALMTRGGDIDEVVDRVLEATKAAVGSVAWNWGAEERTIRRMCESFVVKKMNMGSPLGEPMSNVVSITDGKKPKKAKRDEDETPLHIALTQGFWKALAAQNQRLQLVGRRVWHYKAGMWSEIDDCDAWLERTIQRGCGAMKVSPTIRLVAEVRKNIMREMEYVADREWDVHGLIATQSGLVDLKTGDVRPAEADDYVTHRIECEYDPAAECPNWLRMLDDVTQGMDPKTIDVIQEVLGMALIENKPKGLRKAFVAHGESNSGKSNVISVMANMVADNPITTDFDELQGTHGLAKFSRRSPWLLHEAFNSGKWHFSSRTKTLISGEPVTINEKGKPTFTTRYRMPVFWGTNVEPQFKETSRAIVNRMLIVSFHRIFDKAEGVALEALKAGYEEPSDYILATERPGLLNWGMVGARRALKRGHFEETAAMKQAAHDVILDAKMAARFIEECTVKVPDGRITMADFCAAFGAHWVMEHGRERGVPGNKTIGKSIKGLVHKQKSDAVRYVRNIHLNDEGLAFWNTARSGVNPDAVGKQTGISVKAEDVNKVLVPE